MADFEEYKDISFLGKKEAIAKYGKIDMNVERLPDNTILLKVKGVSNEGSAYIFSDYYIEFLKDRVTARYFVWESRTRKVRKESKVYMYSDYTSIDFIGALRFSLSLPDEARNAFGFFWKNDLQDYLCVPEPNMRFMSVASNLSSVNDWGRIYKEIADSANLLLQEYRRNPEAYANVSPETIKPESNVIASPTTEAITEETKEVVKEEKVADLHPEQTVVSQPIQQAMLFSAPEEIKKYKELLDMGAITQEEYDAKKKQLLGI